MRRSISWENLVRLAPGAAVFATIVGLSLAGGGYGELAGGALTVLAWSCLLIASIAMPGEVRRLPARAAAAAAALALVALLSAISIGFAPDPGAAFADAVRLAGYVGVLLLVVIARRERAGSMLSGIGIAVAFVALLAVGSRLLGLGAGDAELAEVYPGSAGRLSYPIGYWNGLGALMALGAPALVWLGAGRGLAARGATAAFALTLVAAYMTASRGAVLALLLGVAVLLVAAGESRSRLGAVIVVGLAGALPGIVAVQLASGILSEPFTGIGTAELSAALLVALGLGATFAAAPRAIAAAERIPVSGRGLRVGGAILAVLLVASLLAVGPGRIADEFTAISREDSTSLGGDRGLVLSASGSGRAQFWDTALRAFASEPLRGIGAGGFEQFWAREGPFDFVIRSAHSEPLELLAELGPLGLLAFLAFLALVLGTGISRLRPPGEDEEGTRTVAVALAAFSAGVLGLAIDWTWELPAIGVGILLFAGLLLRGGEARDHGPLGGTGPVPLAIASPALAVVTIAVALPLIWAGLTASVGGGQLERSRAELERGHLSDAVRSARTAARLQPWSAEPWVQVALAERAADNDRAALRAAKLAVDRSPEDFEIWRLAAALSIAMRQPTVAAAYDARAMDLAPRIHAATFRLDRGSSSER